MSSSQYGQNLPISELIKTIKYSFRECDFNEVEKVFIDREINMKIEMKDLELENMEVDKLEKCQRKCQELETRNSEQDRFMVRVYQEKFRCLEENEKLKGELTELKKENEKLTTRYNDLAQDHKKLDGKCQELEEQINDLKSKNSENEKFMGRVYQAKFRCLEENEKLKGELTELKKDNEKLTTRYNDLAQDHKKLDGKLIKALTEAIDQAQMEGYTRAQQQVYETFPKTEKNSDENVGELGGETLKQSGRNGLKGSGPRALKEKLMLGSGYSSKTTPSPGICDSNDEPVSCGAPYTSNIRANVGKKEMMLGKNKRKRREDSPVRSTTKRKTSTCERNGDSLPIHKDNEVVESDSEDESCSVSEDSNRHEPERNIKHNYQSQITLKRVKELRAFAGIPPEYKIVIPSLEDRPNSPPPGFLCIYTYQIYGGLRFPIHPLFADISQLAPNAFRIISGFAMAVLYLGEKPTARLFHSYFHPKRTEEGYFYFSSRLDARFLKGQWKPLRAWKKHYCFISSPHPWNFPTIWRNWLPEEKTNVIQRRSPAFKSLLDRLNQNPYNVTRLVEPGLFYHFGLSPRYMPLSKTLDETMAKNLMKEEALKSPKSRQENSLDTSSAKVVKEVVE